MTQKIFIKLIAFSIVFSCILSSKLSAQFHWVQIGVDGLTCSQCTRSVEMNIRKLDFVDSVSMNLENTEGKILFKPGKKVSIEHVSIGITHFSLTLNRLKNNIPLGMQFY